MRTTAAFFAVRVSSASAYFMLVPYLALWLMSERDLGGAEAATVVALCLLFGRTGGLMMARAANRIGLRTAILAAYSLSVACTVAMMLAHTAHTAIWIALAVVLGTSFSTANAALKALVVTSFSAERRLRAFSQLNLAVNGGSAIGVAAGGHLIADAPEHLLWPVAVLYALSAVAVLFTPATERTEHDTAAAPSAGAGPLVGFAVFLLATSATWIAYAQVFNVLPTFSASTVGTKALSYLFVLNALLIIVFQTPFTAAVERLRSLRPGLASAILPGAHLLMALSVLGFGLTGHASIAVAYAAMVIFTVTELTWGPAYDAEIADVKGRLTNMTAYSLYGAVRGGAESLGTWIGLAVVAGSTVAWPADAAVYWISGLALLGTTWYFARGARNRIAAMSAAVSESSQEAPLAADPSREPGPSPVLLTGDPCPGRHRPS